jgi:hypothetical protein
MQVVTKLLLAVCALVIVSAVAFFSCEHRETRPEQIATAPTAPLEPSGLRSARTAVEQPDAGAPQPTVEERVETPAPAASDLPAPRAHITGKVVAREDRRPLEDYSLIVDDGRNQSESLTTDAKGAFESTQDYADGQITVTLIDAPRTESLQFVDGGLAKAWPAATKRLTWSRGREVVIEADVGPTIAFRLSGHGSTRVDTWLASFYDRDPRRSSVFACERAPVRPGASLWCRCAWQAFGDTVDKRTDFGDSNRIAFGELGLVIVSADGLWRGETQIDSSRVAMIEPEPSARLEIAIKRRDHTQPVGANVVLRSLAHSWIRRGDGSWNGSEVTHGSASSTFVFKGLDPGDYSIVASCSGSTSRMQRVRLRGGKIESLDMNLDVAGQSGYLRGSLRSISGTFNKPVILRVTPVRADAERSSLNPCVFQSVGNEMIARFEFPDLPPGDYQVDFIQSGSGRQRWTPHPVTVTAPSEGLEFFCQDVEPLVDVRLDALFSETEAELTNARWHYVIDGIEATAQGAELIIEGVSPYSTFEWCVTAPHCGIVCGGWNELSGGTARIGAARLTRGWGAKIRTVDEDSRVPVAGVALSFDGERVGLTGDDGVLLVERAKSPRQIEARLDGWKPVADLRKLGVVVDDDVQVVYVLPMRRMP